MAPVELQIERLSKSGDGVAQLAGRTVFVSGALPGEVVLAKVTESGRVLRGDLLEVLKPSAARRVAPCALAERCGGCDWQHVDEATQRAEKEEIVASALEHLGHIGRGDLKVLPTVFDAQALGYRRRAVLHRAGRSLGFFGRRSHERVEVDHCPALTAPLQGLPATVGAALQLVLRDVDEVHLLESGGATGVSLHLNGPVRERHSKAGAALVKALGVRGVALVPKSGTTETVGEVELAEAGGTRVRPDAFAQANAAMNALLVQAAVAATGSGSVLELYSGNGNFSLPLAKQASQVLAVESDRVGLGLASDAVRRAGLKNVRFVLGDAAKVADGLAKEGKPFDALLLDPPRSGAPGVAGWAKRLGVRRVVYVACDPGALARDAGALAGKGFKPVTLQLFDLFPQTRHIEALMVFEAVPA